MDANPGLSAAEPCLNATNRSKCGNTESAIPTGARNHAQPRSRRSAPGCWLIHFVTCSQLTNPVLRLIRHVCAMRRGGKVRRSLSACKRLLEEKCESSGGALMRLKAPGTYAAVDRGVAHLCIVVGDDVWMMLGARQVAVGDLHRNTKLGNGVQASREKKQLPHSTLKTFAALLDLTQVVVRADPCEGSLVREPLFKEDTQRNFPISFGRLASTGGCATRCGFSQLAFTAPLSEPYKEKRRGESTTSVQNFTRGSVDGSCLVSATHFNMFLKPSNAASDVSVKDVR